MDPFSARIKQGAVAGPLFLKGIPDTWTAGKGSRLPVRTVSEAKLAKDSRKGETYVRRSEDGRLVYSSVKTKGKTRIITVGIEKVDVPSGGEPQLNWGFYRSSPRKWYHPEGCAPAGSSLSKTNGVMKSPMRLSTSGSHFEAKVQVPANLEPVMLGCSIVLPGPEGQTLPKESGHLCIPIGTMRGSPGLLGALATEKSQNSTGKESYTVNFAAVSRSAASMTLFLVRNSGPDNVGKGNIEIVLDPITNKTGDVWHIAVKGLTDLESLCYGWRAEGIFGFESEADFDPNIILLDPYAQMVTPMALPEAAGPGYGNNPNGDQNSLGLLGCLSHLVEPKFDWGNQSSHRLAVENSVVCMVDLRMIRCSHGVLPHAKRMLQQIEAMGANTVLLKGVHLSDASDGSAGSSPIHYFGPNPSHASNGQAQQARIEFKELVKACHEKNMELLIQVEFGFSPETRANSPRIVSFKGLDRTLYYRNGMLNWGHPVARRLALDSLRNWVQNFKVDGFVLTNAEALTQDRDGVVSDNPPLPESIAHDPLLRRCKMIAVSGDDRLLPRSGERGFPHWGTWLEWNKRFQKDVWEYMMEGQDDKLSAMATRITGSADLFAARLDEGLPGCLAVGRRPSFGLNSALPVHLSLSDAFAGDISTARDKIKSILLASIIFQGIPVLPVDVVQNQLLQSLVKSVLSIRSEHKDLLAPPEFASMRHFEWHGAGGGSQPLWDGGGKGCNYIGYSIRPSPEDTRGIYVGFNPHDYELPVYLPEPGSSAGWRCLLDTMDECNFSEVLATYVFKPQSAVIFDLISRSQV